MREIRPQEGYQHMALSSPADIVIGGGSAGVGKTWTLLMDPLRDVHRPKFDAVIFRRTSVMIRSSGGLWDASNDLYQNIPSAKPTESRLKWSFPSGATLRFSHLEYEKNKYDHQGSEIAMIGFDELTHFSRTMFFYMLSRNRSTCGCKPYVRATCNPDPDSWVRTLIDWWIGEDGFPIEERRGVVRHFMVHEDNYIWGDTAQDVIDKASHIIQPMLDKDKSGALTAESFVKSLTFIGGSIYDNVELLKKDPGYLGNLNAQSADEKARLLDGNWNIKISKDDIYKYTAFRNIFTNHYVKETSLNATRVITTDIAMKGSDKFVIFVWQGKMLIDFKVMSKSNGKEVIDSINEMAYKHEVMQSNIIFDNDGVGAFIDGYIEDAREFKNGGRPIDGENYKNLKSQCYIKSGDAVTKGEYYIPPEVANRPYDDNRTLKEQLMYERKAIKRDKPDYDGKLATIPKHEMMVFLDGKSPDLMDAFMMHQLHELDGEGPEVDYSY